MGCGGKKMGKKGRKEETARQETETCCNHQEKAMTIVSSIESEMMQEKEGDGRMTKFAHDFG